MNMKKTIWSLLLIVGATSCAQEQKNSEINQLVSPESVKFIAAEYGNALTEYAKAMPIMGQDTESVWAAQMVDSLNNELQNNECCYVEALARLAMMETYATYGLGYQVYIYASSYSRASMLGVEQGNGAKIDPEDVDASLRVIHTHDSIYHLIENSGFTDAQRLFELMYSTDYQKLQFAKFRDIMLSEERFDISGQESSMEELELLNTLYADKKWNETDLFRLGTMIEATPYFFCTASYYYAYASTPEAVQRARQEGTNHAVFCDLLTRPIATAEENPEKIGEAIDQLLAENECTYEVLMRQYATQKAGMLNLITLALKEIRELGLNQ